MKRTRASATLARRVLRKLSAVWVHACTKIHDLIFPFRVQFLSGPRWVSASADDFVVVCLVRNGAAYIAEFIRHYRELGAKHIVFLDNDSTDGTPALVAGEPGVTVVRTSAPFKIYRDVMRRWLVTRYGRRNWVLCVDIDELFDYPFRKDIGTASLLRYLNRCRFTAVVAQMLDMFPQTSITESSGAGWRDRHCFYSLRNLEKEPYETYYGKSNAAAPAELEVLHGGVRSSAFDVRALLTKHPLLFPSRGISYLHPHHISGARVADVSAVLLHYKYVGNFAEYVKAIVKEESFSMNSREYKQYLRAIEADSGLSLYSSTALEFSTVEKLLDEGFLVASEQFRREARRVAARS